MLEQERHFIQEENVEKTLAYSFQYNPKYNHLFAEQAAQRAATGVKIKKKKLTDKQLNTKNVKKNKRRKIPKNDNEEILNVNKEIPNEDKEILNKDEEVLNEDEEVLNEDEKREKKKKESVVENDEASKMPVNVGIEESEDEDMLVIDDTATSDEN